MPLSPGHKLGPYEIVAPLGAGGMGEVYRARDTRLGRDVAVKILPKEMSADPVRKQRFEREAKTISGLNHPNICTLHDVGRLDGVDYLVMECVEGETLAKRLRKGALPLKDTIRIAMEVCEALEVAHRAGIVHRDLKPGNIMLTKAAAKLMDFGVAKATGGNKSAAALQSAETLSVAEAIPPLTEDGRVIGTIQYMSPEQLEGKEADARSDIFSLGAVMYEMASGKRAFEGKNQISIASAILEKEPEPISQIQKMTPPAFERVVRTCLEKNPGERYQSAHDVRLNLKWIGEEGLQQAAQKAATAAYRWRRILPWVIAGASLILAGVAILAVRLTAARSWWLRLAQTERTVLVQRITDFVGIEESPAISPDGKTVAFVAPVNGKKQIWIRLLAGGTPLRLTHDDADHEHPRWAPDSSSLIYFTSSASQEEPRTIWEVSALGGIARRIASAVSAGDISHDGRRIAVFQLRGADVELVTMSRDGIVLRELKHFPTLYGYDMPRWSPDDRSIAYVRGWSYAFDFAVEVIPTEGGEPRDVAHGEMLRGFSWLPDGSGFVYSSSFGSTILYPPTFNLRIVQRDGGGDRQLTFGEVSYLEPDVSIGRVAASRLRIQSDVWRVPVSGSPQQNTRDAVRITHQTGQVQTPSLSPDGKEFVYLSDSGGHGNLWVAATNGSTTRQITFEHDPAVVIGVPIWSPAGNQIVFILTRQGRTGEWVVSPDGSNLRQLVPSGSGANWSPDGQWLYYQTEHCIDKVPVGGGPAVQVRCDNSPFPESLSPDGSTLYYSSGTNGAAGAIGSVEIRKARPENGPSELLASIPASRLPLDGWVWQQVLSPDGTWLGAPFLDRGTTNLWAMPVDGGPMRQLTDFGQRSIFIGRRISWSPDGKFIYAALADTDADVVLLDGLLP